MFEDYSIAGASQSHDFYAVMDEDISPTSSCTTTPTPEEARGRQSSSSMDSVADLSNRLEQHTLGARQQRLDALEPPALSPLFLEMEPQISSSLGRRRRRSSSLLIRQQRQALTRRQCIPAHPSHIAALVEDVSKDINNPYHEAPHPSSTYHPTPVSPTSNPSSFASFDSTPCSSGSEDCGSESSSCMSSRMLASKEWRRAGSSEATERKQKLVLKKIRMRRSLMRMEAGG